MSGVFEDIGVIVSGVEWLFNGNPFHFLGEDDFGAPNSRRNTERGAQQDGDSDLGGRLEPRTLNVVVGIEAYDAGDLWDHREQLLKLFSPYRNVTLFVRRKGVERRLDCVCAGGLRMPKNDRTGHFQKSAIALRAADPTWYDAEQSVVNFNLGGGTGQFTVPTPVATAVGASTIDMSVAVSYAGSWLSQPNIRIAGPITNPVITNQTTGEKLDFTGTTIGVGQYYDIDTRYGYKTVIDQAGVNQISKLTSDSDLATFHLEPDSDTAPFGINSIQVTGSSINTTTEVYVTYFTRYIGI